MMVLLFTMVMAVHDHGVFVFVFHVVWILLHVTVLFVLHTIHSICNTHTSMSKGALDVFSLPIHTHTNDTSYAHFPT